MRVRRGMSIAWTVVMGWIGLSLSLWAQENPLWEQGVQLFQKKDYAGAAAVFEQVVAENPTHPAGYYMLALCQLNLNKMVEAEKNLQKVVELEPKHFGAYYYLATWLCNGSSTRPSSSTSTRACRMRPDRRTRPSCRRP